MRRWIRACMHAARLGGVACLPRQQVPVPVQHHDYPVGTGDSSTAVTSCGRGRPGGATRRGAACRPAQAVQVHHCTCLMRAAVAGVARPPHPSLHTQGSGRYCMPPSPTPQGGTHTHRRALTPRCTASGQFACHAAVATSCKHLSRAMGMHASVRLRHRAGRLGPTHTAQGTSRAVARTAWSLTKVSNCFRCCTQ